jgi:hypothetical protein
MLTTWGDAIARDALVIRIPIAAIPQKQVAIVTPGNIRREKSKGLYVDPLVRVPLHIPARRVAEVRKQRTNTYLVLGRGIIVFCPAIFLLNRIIGLDGHGRKRIAASGNLKADRKIVAGVGE